MDMVGHGHKLVDFDTWVMGWDFLPHGAHHFSGGGALNRTIRNIAEQATPSLRADRHKIQSCPGIIVTPQTNGPAVMDGGIVCHAGLRTASVVRFMVEVLNNKKYDDQAQGLWVSECGKLQDSDLLFLWRP